MMNNTAKVNIESDPSLDLRDHLLEDKFKVLQRIARGSYAEIFLGQILDESDSSAPTNMVAVKALNVNLHGVVDADLERTLTENIYFEAEVLRQLDHPLLPRFISAGWSRNHNGQDFFYIVQELVEGQTLSKRCLRPLPLEKLLAFTGQLTGALDYIHGLGIIHRDIKPNNIIVSPDDSMVKLIDFGVSKSLTGGNGYITQVGTETYSAPEHQSLASDCTSFLTPSTDVYSLAKSIYFMLTGKPPTAFRQKRITALPVQIDTQFWSQPALEVLSRATKDAPADRYASAGEFQKALIDALEITSVKSSQNFSGDDSEKRQRIFFDLRKKPSWLAEKFYQLLPVLSGVAKRALRLIGRMILWLGKFAGQYTEAIFSSFVRQLKTCVAPAIFNRRILKLIAKIILSIVLIIAAVLAFPKLFQLLNQNFFDRWVTDTKTPIIPSGYAIAVIDINLRVKASGKSAKIGLVPKDSMVKILSTSENGNWCEIEIRQYSRAKEDSSFQDRGWVNKSNLKVQ